MAEGGVPVGRNKPGYAALVVNIESVRPDLNDFRPRPSAREDITNLLYIFNKLGLTCINESSSEHTNLTVPRWDHRRGGNRTDSDVENCGACLQCKIRSKDHSESRCFFLAMSSHGREITETEVMFSDEESVKLTEIFDALSDENCPSLKGIPRIILILACRGNFKDPERNQARQDCGVPINISNKPKGKEDHKEPARSVRRTNSPTPLMSGASSAQECYFHHASLSQLPNDFLLVYPSVSGQLTHSNETDGSWLVNAMKDAINEYLGTVPPPTSLDFFHLITAAAGRVAMRESHVLETDNNGQKVGRNGKRKLDTRKDEEKSGFKNAVCSHHRLSEPLDFDLNHKQDSCIPKPTFF